MIEPVFGCGNEEASFCSMMGVDRLEIFCVVEGGRAEAEVECSVIEKSLLLARFQNGLARLLI